MLFVRRQYNLVNMISRQKKIGLKTPWVFSLLNSTTELLYRCLYLGEKSILFLELESAQFCMAGSKFETAAVLCLPSTQVFAAAAAVLKLGCPN